MQREIDEIFRIVSENEVCWRQSKTPLCEKKLRFQCSRLRRLVLPVAQRVLRAIEGKPGYDDIREQMEETVSSLSFPAEDTDSLLIHLHTLISMFHGTNSFGKRIRELGDVAKSLMH